MKMLAYLPVTRLLITSCTFHRKMKKFAKSLEKIQSLVTLCFERVSVALSFDNAALLRNTIRKLKNLKALHLLSNCRQLLAIFTVSNVTTTLSIRNLEVLDVSGSNLQSYFTKRDPSTTLLGAKRSFDGLPLLISLNLSSNGLSSQVCKKIIKSFKNLKKLDLSKNKITGPEIEQIGEISGLQTLDLSNNAIMVPSFAKGLSKLTSLHTLSLRRAGINGEGVALIAEASKNGRLINLNLTYNEIAGPEIEQIGEISGLQTLDLSYNPIMIPSFAKGLSKLTSLENLNLRGTGIDSKGAVLIGKMFNKLPRFQSLQIEQNAIMGSEIDAIVSRLHPLCLSQFQNITTLIRGSRLSPTTILILSEIFGPLEGFERPSLSDQEIDAPATQDIDAPATSFR